MGNNKTVTVISVVIIAITAFFTLIITLGLFATTSKVAGMLFLGAGLFFIAYMMEMAMPDAMFMRMVMCVSGLGFATTSMMEALFPQLVVQVMMYSLMALSMVQILFESVPSTNTSPDS